MPYLEDDYDPDAPCFDKFATEDDEVAEDHDFIPAEPVEIGHVLWDRRCSRCGCYAMELSTTPARDLWQLLQPRNDHE